MNDNKKIAVNSVVIFLRLIITSLVGIYISRVVLDALGASDYGLYNVVGGIVTMLNVMNSAMLSTTYRYIAFELGKGNNADTRRVFNTCFQIHIFFAIFIVLLGLTLGEWYIDNFLNVADGKLPDAKFVFHISLLTAAISTLLVPFQGLIVAFEKFVVNAIIDIISFLFRLGIIVAFIYSEDNRLRLYSILQLSYNILSCSLYLFYCIKNYFPIIKWHVYNDWKLCKEMFSYATWTLFGAFAAYGKTQGSAIIVNFFFGTIVNAAFAVANQVESFILMFARSLSNAAVPQITKNFSGGNETRSIKLTSYISKYTFILMSMVAFPVMLEMEFLLGLWLKDIPEGAVLFCQLTVLGGLIGCLGEGIPALINATGNIKTYQIIFHTFNLLGLPIAFIFYRYGYPAETILIVYCVIGILAAFLRIFLMKKIYKFDVRMLIKVSYSKIFIISVPLVVYFYLYNCTQYSVIEHICGLVLSELYLFLVIAIVGIDKAERGIIKNVFKSKFKKS